VSLAAAQREVCRKLQRAHPELKLDCEKATLAAAAPVEPLQ
jgi:hypothetical protein